MSRRRRIRVMEWGEEIQCTRCHGWWPHDDEFFHLSVGKRCSWCRACCAEHKQLRYREARARKGLPTRPTRAPIFEVIA